MAEEFVGVVENVQVLNFSLFTSLCADFRKGLFNRLSRTDVACARGGGK
jgi:hypothetical protein